MLLGFLSSFLGGRVFESAAKEQPEASRPARPPLVVHRYLLYRVVKRIGISPGMMDDGPALLGHLEAKLSFQRFDLFLVFLLL